jgi:hypothetical protein
MGADFSSHKVFAHPGDPGACREAVIAELRRLMGGQGLVECPDEGGAERSFVVGPPARWIHVGDSAGSTETADPDAFDEVGGVLSHLGAVVDIKWSDDAVVHLLLYRAGELVDKFGNGNFPWFSFESAEEARAYWGCPQLWSDLLRDGTSIAALRSAWVQEWRASEILATTADLLGWETELLNVGYTFDDEGIPIKYDEFLADSGVDLTQFQELHFGKSAEADHDDKEQ